MHEQRDMSTIYAYADDFRTGLQFGKMRDPEYYPRSPEVLQSMLKGKLKQHEDHADGYGDSCKRKHNRNVKTFTCRMKSEIPEKKRNTKVADCRSSKATTHVHDSVQASAASTLFTRSSHISRAQTPNSSSSNLKYRRQHSEQPHSIPKYPQEQTSKRTPSKVKNFHCNAVQQRSIRKWLQVLRIPISKIEEEANASSPLCNGGAISHLVRF